MIADDLLQGAIDLHVHGYPEIAFDVSKRLDDVEIANVIQDSGMKGFVLKSNFFPTVGRAYHLNQQFPEIQVFPSITLNWPAGGLCPIAVESAARQGAKVIFMPTWSSANDLKRGGLSKFMKNCMTSTKCLNHEKGLSLLDNNDQIRSEVKEIIDIAKEHGLVIATGHISAKESKSLMNEANRVGFGPIIYSHPNTPSVGGILDDMKLMADKGAFVEFCTVGMMPALQGFHPKDVAELILSIGAERCVLSSDFFFDWAPPPPEMLRMLIATFLSLGLSEDEIRMMVQTNPDRILNV